MSSRIAQPRAHIFRSVRSSVRWNDAGFMTGFDEDHHEIFTLDDLVAGIVAWRQHRRPRALIDAARADRDALHGIVISATAATTTTPSTLAFLCVGRQWRNLSS